MIKKTKTAKVLLGRVSVRMDESDVEFDFSAFIWFIEKAERNLRLISV